MQKKMETTIVDRGYIGFRGFGGLGSNSSLCSCFGEIKCEQTVDDLKATATIQ